MRYRLLGRSALRVSELCLGAMTFGTGSGFGADAAEAGRVFAAFLEAGGNFVDTANIYGKGESEVILAELIAPVRSRLVLASKYSLTTAAADPNAGGNHRKSLREALEASLKRLRTDYIDLYWVHAYDGLTSLFETLRALEDAVRAGKILHVGISNAPAWWIARAVTVAELKDLTAFTAIQVLYNLTDRSCERELVPLALELNLAVTAWSPLAGGLLTGKYLSGGRGRLVETAWGHGLINPRNETIARALAAVAVGLNRHPAQVALAWLRQVPGGVVPIVGARCADQLRCLLGCLDFDLTEDARTTLDAASAIDLGYPHSLLNNPAMRSMILGDHAAWLDGSRASHFR